MDRRTFKNFITKRSTVWTLSLCMTGILVLGGIAAVENTRRAKDYTEQSGDEPGKSAYLDGESADSGRDIEDSLFPVLGDDSGDDMAQASGNTVEEDVNAQLSGDEAAAETPENPEPTDAQAGDGDLAQEAASGEVISDQALIDQGISFTEEQSLLWPSAGTILIDYSMDGSVYFPTLDQYRYNPALIIGSETGNQVLASAKGVVESVGIEDETGTTLVMNIGNGYRLTYGQLKELAVAQGDVVEAGALLGYVSEPTKYYSEEGSNLYFGMTQNGEAVDPVLYLE